MGRRSFWLGIALLAALSYAPVAAQDAVPTADTLADVPMPQADVADRRAAPNPSDAQQALMDELTEVSDATHLRNELEAAQRMAPIDLLYGLPEAT